MIPEDVDDLDAPALMDLSCPDWEERLRQGRSLVPDLPLDLIEGDRAVAAFNRLRLADVNGTPTMADAGGDWFRDIVRALFGSVDRATGVRAIRELFLLIPKKNSKALSLDTPIATPEGFTTMGDIAVGDLVLDLNGNPTEVLAKSEVFTHHECFDVEFSTGEHVICDAEHLWVTDAHLDRDRQERNSRTTPAPSVKTTAEIARSVKVKSGRYSINNHRTALPGSLNLPAAELPIPPYVLGAWLGDGATWAPVISAGAADAEHMVSQLHAAGHPAVIKGFDTRSGVAWISISHEAGNRRLPYRFRTAAIALGVLGNKHVPRAYLRASQEQRLDLLRGLMDTDGTIAKGGQASYSTTTQALKDDIIELVNSLGMKATVSELRATLHGKDHGPCWNVRFWPFDSVGVFTLPRKLERQRARTARNKPRSATRQIVAVRPVDSVPTQCISVVSETKQFLITRSLIPTHNTTNGALLMLVALLLNKRPRASFIMTAPVQDVADLAFSAVSGAITLDKVLEKKLDVKDYKKTIIHRQTKATLEIMTFDPAILTGQKISGGALIDELHVVGKMAKSASAIRQIRGGMLPFDEAFLLFITTQSEEPPKGIFHTELQKARAIRDGTRQGAMLPMLYEFPEKMQRSEEWRDPKHWHMVTPNAGRSISIPRLVGEYKVAEATGKDELAAWCSQHLDIEMGIALHSDRWAGIDFWVRQAAKNGLTLKDILQRSEVITIGVDGGGLDDLLGLSVLGREDEKADWLHWGHAWAHPIVFDRRKADVALFRDFESDGDLTIVKSIGDDMTGVADIVEECEDSGLLDKIGVDQAGIGSIVDAITARGIEHDRIIGIPQGWKLQGAILTMERKLASGEFHHGGRRMMAWTVGNAKSEPRGNAVMITKQSSGRAKIDPLMALFDSVALMGMNPKPRKRKFQTFFL